MKIPKKFWDLKEVLLMLKSKTGLSSEIGLGDIYLIDDAIETLSGSSLGIGERLRETSFASDSEVNKDILFIYNLS